ncbi:MAG: hypothetical protein WAT53_08005 [Nitrosomonas sp.]|nr:hypothetical protein [Nitrosomonas sp.]MCC7136788.1 hypothetical protein [Nitrosomonas sp.]
MSAPCFGALEDYSAYVGWLKEYSAQHAMDIHAWVGEAKTAKKQGI